MAQNGDSGSVENVASDKEVRNPVLCKVLLLDGSDYEVTISKNDMSQVLVDKVCDHIQLADKEYFSCSYVIRGVRYWINPDREISKAGKKANWTFSFEVKFYPLDPTYLDSDFTRYLIFLQVRLDIVNGKLPCSFLTQALLGSYAVQSDIGDYDEHQHGDTIEYIRDIRFVDKQSDELLVKIAELHRTHLGMQPDEAESDYLENARNLAQYGVHDHIATDMNGDEVEIGVSGIGIVIYKNHIRVRRYQWAKILKIIYKRNKFTLRIRPEEMADNPEVLVYKLHSYEMAKRLWRIAVEHHGFFRLKKPDERKRAQFPHFGPKFRYSGRTEFQKRDGFGTKQRPQFGKKDRTLINRKASTRFQGARANAVDANAPGFSTDRAEQMIMAAPATNTLDLKNKKMNRSGSIPQIDDGTASIEDKNKNLSVIDPGGDYGTDGSVSMTRQSVTYTTTTSAAKRATPMYDQYGNPIMTDDYSTDGSTMEDYRRQQMSTGGQWSTGQTSRSTTKTSTRTYTDADGNIVTEHITERDGVVVDRRIEKKTRTGAPVDDDVDYDKALRDAIQSVTDMNPDMSVQKIEIHTKTETSTC